MESNQKKKGKMVMSNNGSQQREEEDRLSSLPDCLLIKILSLLSIHSAVATSTLSRRWRHLWTEITHLNFLFILYSEPFNSVVTIVDHVISQLKSPKIHTFHFSHHRPSLFYEHPNRNSVVADWFHQICRRNPETVTFGLGVANASFEVPYCLFEAQSLVQLHLGDPVNLNCLLLDEKKSPVKLPNLKKLRLILEDPQLDLVRENGPLFKGCPLLEDLSLILRIDEQDRTVHISIPNLKRLILEVMEESMEKCKIVIHAPKLEIFESMGGFMSYEFVQKPCDLQSVDLLIEGDDISIRQDDDDFMSDILGLMEGIFVLDPLC